MLPVVRIHSPSETLDTRRSSSKNRLFSLGMILLVLGIYSYPAIQTTATTGSRVLPPISAPDLSLYLNISKIQTVNPDTVVDPYYGVTAPVARMGYLKFHAAFALFSQLSQILRGNLWWTLLLWNLFWWALLCVIAIWFFENFLPDQSPEAVIAGLAFLMFFNFGILQGQLGAWMHIRSAQAFRSVEFPFIRPFFPQVPIPLVLLYLGLQIRALQKKTWRLWAAMSLTQLLAFMVFPYAMLMMAGISAVAIVGQLISRTKSVPWVTIAIYAAACALGDLIFFFHGSGITRTGAPGQYSLIHLDLSVLPHRIGGMWLVLAALTALVFVVRDSAPEVKWSLVGLGLTNLFLLAGDALFSETALQVSHHGGYFVQLTATVLFVFVASAGTRYFANRSGALRFVLGAIIVFLVLNGILIARATYQVFLPYNQEDAQLTRALQSDSVGTDDLVIARSVLVDDDCAWVPLASSAHSLYCRSAQVLLSPEQNQQIQRFRQGLYLYFTNKDRNWVEHVLDDPNAVTELTRLMFLGQVTTDLAERKKGIEAVRAELLPVLDRAERNDPEVRSFFSRYRRILVVDNTAHPDFSSSRLSEYLKIEKEQTIGNLLIRTYRPAAD